MKSLATRFWEKVLIGGPGCWEWTACKSNGGYGYLRVAGKNVFSHRQAWELTHGEIKNGLWVLHKCDNRGCVRPDHLFLGTHLDNVKDKTAKGRAWRPTGSKHPGARLCVSDILAIRAAISSGEDAKTVAAHYKITRRHAAAIFYREKWKSVA